MTFHLFAKFGKRFLKPGTETHGQARQKDTALIAGRCDTCGGRRCQESWPFHDARWRRIQKLEEDGVIKRRVAILDPVRVNARVTVFVSVRTSSHSHEWLKRFSEVVQEFPEVIEFYRMSGDVDYLLRVAVPDIAAYDAFYKRLISKIEIRDVSSSFAMEQIKYTTELPLDYMVLDKDNN